MIDDKEFEKAFLKAREKYPSLQKSDAKDFLFALRRRIDANRQNRHREKFSESLRQTLNSLKLVEHERSPYKCLTGFYFGKRGNDVQKRRPAPKIVKREYSPVRILIDSKGQYGFEI